MPGPALQTHLSLSTERLVGFSIRKITAAGWRLDWTQIETIRGGQGRRKTGFPSPGDACSALARVTHWAWPPGSAAGAPMAPAQLTLLAPSPLPPCHPFLSTWCMGETGSWEATTRPQSTERDVLSMLMKRWLLGQERSGSGSTIKGKELIDKTRTLRLQAPSLASGLPCPGSG